MTCHCGQPFAKRTPPIYTLVGYSSPPGHDHDDNCAYRLYACPDGHMTRIYIRRRCPAEGCGWVGKATCRICPGEKLDAWPDAAEMNREETLAALKENR